MFAPVQGRLRKSKKVKHTHTQIDTTHSTDNQAQRKKGENQKRKPRKLKKGRIKLTTFFFILNLQLTKKLCLVVLSTATAAERGKKDDCNCSLHLMTGA